ncbi:rhodanese-like domain-containing protein [Haloferula sp.]|uniref:rhodanese-like domain-containing protein n=1 Tax=Haloferula sp. TaxID=2497595 RepID=UPI00329F5D53
MKSVVELGLIAGVAVVAGLGNWLVGGKPSGDPVLELEQIPLKEGEVYLSEALEWDKEGVVWVDARPAEKWREETMAGSINITMQSDEDLGAQIANHVDAILGASRVIVFCDDVHCSVSHDLREQLKGEYRDLVAGEIFVLHGGMTALRAAGKVTSSSPSP